MFSIQRSSIDASSTFVFSICTLVAILFCVSFLNTYSTSIVMLNARSKAANVIGLPKKRNTEPKNRKVNHDNIAFQQHLDYCDVSDENRFDCTPGGMSQEECLAHGCCWREAVILMRTINIPYCFFPSNYYIYNIEGEIKKTDLGYEAELTM